MKEFKIALTEEEVNYVLGAIGERPFNECANILTKIQKQSTEQYREQEAKEEKPEEIKVVKK